MYMDILLKYCYQPGPGGNNVLKYVTASVRTSPYNIVMDFMADGKSDFPGQLFDTLSSVASFGLSRMFHPMNYRCDRDQILARIG